MSEEENNSDDSKEGLNDVSNSDDVSSTCIDK